MFHQVGSILDSTGGKKGKKSVYATVPSPEGRDVRNAVQQPFCGPSSFFQKVKRKLKKYAAQTVKT